MKIKRYFVTWYHRGLPDGEFTDSESDAIIEADIMRQCGYNSVQIITIEYETP